MRQFKMAVALGATLATASRWEVYVLTRGTRRRSKSRISGFAAARRLRQHDRQGDADRSGEKGHDRGAHRFHIGADGASGADGGQGEVPEHRKISDDDLQVRRSRIDGDNVVSGNGEFTMLSVTGRSRSS
jgi:hypothetical protein